MVEERPEQSDHKKRVRWVEDVLMPVGDDESTLNQNAHQGERHSELIDATQTCPLRLYCARRKVNSAG